MKPKTHYWELHDPYLNKNVSACFEIVKRGFSLQIEHKIQYYTKLFYHRDKLWLAYYEQRYVHFKVPVKVIINLAIEKLRR